MLKPVLGSLPRGGDAHGIPMPVGLWLFNEGSGLIVRDLSGNGHHGTLTDGALFQAGTLGPDVYFDGTDDHIVTPNAGRVTTRDFTLVVWGSTTGGAGEEYLFGCQDGSDHTVQIGMYQNLMRIGIKDGTNFRGSGGLTTINDGVFRQMAWTVRADGFWMPFINGQRDVADWLDISTVANVTVAVAPYIGARNSNGSDAAHWGPGVISLMYYFKPALTEVQTAQLYREAFCMVEREPIELWVGSVGAGAPPAGIPIFRRRRECA